MKPLNQNNMKVKLIKKKEGWYNLYDGEIGIGSTHEELQGFKLSLKNCQSIERGYDLDKLAYDYSWNHQSDPKWGGTIDIFKDGFQKALEILGDKKFSINEVVELTKILISNPFETCGKTYQELTDSYIQSLQQTEWDVEVEKENVMHDYNGNISLGAKFKLDAEGCLILKLKSE